MATAVSGTDNRWLESKCARAFWSQHELPAFRRLIDETASWLDVQAGARWLDLGCGSGMLSRAIWEKSRGTVGEIIGLDCAAKNERAYERLRATVQPPATADRLHFVRGDFSAGLCQWPANHFHGVVSGLAIQYAESWSAQQNRWTTAAYDRVFAEICRLLRPGGMLVFSVNVPEPSWLWAAVHAVPAFFTSRRPLRFLKRSWRMLRYSHWLKEQARRGRFHYLPAISVQAKLTTAGFVRIEHRTSFLGQAYLFRAYKPA